MPYYGVYILQTIEGYRIIQSKDIGNLYWWASCCPTPDIKDYSLEVDGMFHDKCMACGTLDPETEKREEANPNMIIEFFGRCTTYDTEKEVLEEACNMFDEKLYDDLGTVSYIRGWEDKFFPDIKEKNNG